jgi:hypothetical protein
MLFLPSVLEILHASVRMYRQHAALFLGYASWLFVPILLMIGLELFPYDPVAKEVSLILISFVEFFLSLWIGIVLIRITSILVIKKSPNADKIAKESGRIVFPLLFVALIQMLIIGGGFLLLIIPGILFLVWYSFAQFAVILEGKRGLDALTWSKQIVEGHFWRVLWKLFGGPLILALIYSVLIGVIISLISMAIDYDLTAFTATSDVPLWMTVIDATAQVFLLPLYLIYTTHVYKLFLALKRAETHKPAKPKTV